MKTWNIKKLEAVCDTLSHSGKRAKSHLLRAAFYCSGLGAFVSRRISSPLVSQGEVDAIACGSRPAAPIKSVEKLLPTKTLEGKKLSGPQGVKTHWAPDSGAMERICSWVQIVFANSRPPAVGEQCREEKENQL